MTEVDPARRLIEADREAALARERLTATIGQVQERLAPARLAEDASRELFAAGHKSAQAAVRHRGALAGIAGGLVLLLARGPLVRAWRRRRAPETGATPPR